MRSFVRSRLPLVLLAAAAGLALALSGCRKITFTTDGQDTVSFDPDTLLFDTVFTTVGSVTRDFLVINPHKQPIRISSIMLAGGETSLFRINVDGIPGVMHEDVEIGPEDSIYVFVEVTVDPVSGATPMVIEDSVIFLTNGNRQRVVLVAWGQNAHFYNGQRLCDQTWTDDLPHVVYNYAQVDSGCTLTVTEGCRVHFHGNSGLLVDGRLEVLGTADSVVTFESDRLEPFFDDKPGQWDGIFFLRGSGSAGLDRSLIRHAVIKNVHDGILAGFSKSSSLGDFNAGNMPRLDLESVVIHDCTGNGILALLSDIRAENLLVYNTGASDAALLLGGLYEFEHATLANYGSVYVSHQDPILVLSNFFNFGPDEGGVDQIVAADLAQAEFTNCIVEGSILNSPGEPDEPLELVLADIGDGTTALEVNFTNCILRTETDPGSFENTGCQFNADPLFADRSMRDYRLGEGSPAIDAGVPTFVTPDLDGNPRPFMGTDPDLGAYESGYGE